MTDWNPAQYLAFADERTRPARDLLAQVPLGAPQLVYDLGCGPGNSTALLAEAFPAAAITGVDSSPAMLETARASLPSCRFVAGDLSTWSPDGAADLLFANAVLQWIPDHDVCLQRLAGTLAPGGVLAVQMPDNLAEPSHALMREVAAAGPWADRLRGAEGQRAALLTPQRYYDLLKPVSARVDIWHTIYNHPLAGPEAIVQWLMATGLRPYLEPLQAGERTEFLARYRDRLQHAYPAGADGRSLLRFPRLFIVAIR